MSNDSIENQFAKKWQAEQDESIPEHIDQNVRGLVLDAFNQREQLDDPSSKRESESTTWLYALAASLLIAILSWQFIEKDDFLAQDIKLASVISESQQLEIEFGRLNSKVFNEFVYIQKFRLETQLHFINEQLAEAYSSQDDLQNKLQLWSQRNHTLLELNTLLLNAGAANVTHI